MRLYNILYGLHGHLAQYPLQTVRGWNLKPHMAYTGNTCVYTAEYARLRMLAKLHVVRAAHVTIGRDIVVPLLSDSIAGLECKSPLLNCLL